MDEWMDGWRDGWVGEWMDGLTENDHRMKEYKGVVIKKKRIY